MSDDGAIYTEHAAGLVGMQGNCATAFVRGDANPDHVFVIMTAGLDKVRVYRVDLDADTPDLALVARIPPDPA